MKSSCTENTSSTKIQTRPVQCFRAEMNWWFSTSPRLRTILTLISVRVLLAVCDYVGCSKDEFACIPVSAVHNNNMGSVRVRVTCFLGFLLVPGMLAQQKRSVAFNHSRELLAANSSVQQCVAGGLSSSSLSCSCSVRAMYASQDMTATCLLWYPTIVLKRLLTAHQ